MSCIKHLKSCRDVLSGGLHVPPGRLKAGGGRGSVSGREHPAVLPLQVLSCNLSACRSPSPRLGAGAACVLGELIRANPINISRCRGPVIIPRIIWDAGWDGGVMPSET